MTAIEEIGDRVPLPATPEGWSEYRYTALADGRLALIRTSIDVHTEHKRWWDLVSGGNHRQPYPKVWDGDMRLSIYDGIAETDVAIMPSGAWPLVDRMIDGRWLIASSRAQEGEYNGRIYSADGQMECELALGDGIENLLCSPDGTIWAGYFDEGVYGGPNSDGSWPVSCGGIVQFDVAGTPLWSFNEQAAAIYSVDDSYAMTLTGTDLWACFYTNFPITRISGGKATFWSNSVAGAKAIAVDGDIVMFGGGYEDNGNRLTLVKLGEKSSYELGSFQFRKEPPDAASLLQGRGSIVHIVSDGVWTKVPVHEAVAAAVRGT